MIERIKRWWGSDAMIEAGQKAASEWQFAPSFFHSIYLAMKAQEQASVHSPDEVVERVARAMCAHAGNDPESTIGTGGAPLWKSYSGMARAAIAVYEAKEMGE